ncbi:MAG: hemolysin family protein [Desulfopila sp.]|jgi:CBS domain containing-hemolysin-like protein|nr:hemolysin family protein [Desulfopila sp.]
MAGRLPWMKLICSMSFALWIVATAPEVLAAEPSPHLYRTSSDVVLLIIYVLAALGFSFLCSVAEAVLLSITPSYIEGLKRKRPKQAALLQRLKQDNLDRSLAAILTLNTIAHTVGAIGAGAKAAVVFGSAWFGVFSAVMTLMILFLSEIVPKTFGAIYWSHLAKPTALFVQALILALYPLVLISEKLTRIISHGKRIHIFSREEFIAMSRLGEQTGQINQKESQIIRNLFRFGALRARDIMTPRPVIAALSENETLQGAFEIIRQKPFSRFPVFNGKGGEITGFVLKNDIFLNHVQGKGGETLRSLKREISAVPETISLSMVLDHLLKERQHIAIVVDEYGGTTGLVTLEDLLETLIGFEITDESDTVEDMRVLARKLWADRIKALGIEHSDESTNSEIQTRIRQ